MIKHLIFDFDGVIVDSEILAAKAFSQTLSNMNINYKPEYFAEKFAGNKMITVVENLSLKHEIGNKKEFFNNVMKLVSNIFNEELKPVLNIKQLLISNNLNRFIASNSGKQRIIKGLKIIGLNSFFHYNNIYSFETVKKPKPSPDIYIKVVEENNLYKNEVLVLEDSITGVTAAKLANLKVIGITAGTHWNNRSPKSLIEAGACTILDSFLEFEDLLRKIS